MPTQEERDAMVAPPRTPEEIAAELEATSKVIDLMAALKESLAKSPPAPPVDRAAIVADLRRGFERGDANV